MKSTELKLYQYVMFITYSLILILIVFKALSYKSNSKVYPTEKSILKTSYIIPKDLDKESLSLQKRNYYEHLWNEK